MTGELKQRFDMIQNIQADPFNEAQLLQTIARLSEADHSQDKDEEQGVGFEHLPKIYEALFAEGNAHQFTTYILREYEMMNISEATALLDAVGALLHDKITLLQRGSSTTPSPTCSSR